MTQIITAAINRYKSRKYWRHFSSWITNTELDLTIEWLYFLTRGGVKAVYDVGAADGRFAAACAKLNNIESVVAFEPGSEAFVQLDELTRKFHKLVVVPVALGAKTEPQVFYVAKDRRTSSCLPPNDALSELYPGKGLQQETTVEVETLDVAVRKRQLPPPDIIKLDTQGYELEVLRGGAKTMETVSFCIVECCYEPLYTGAPLIGDVFEYFKQLGWRNVGTAPSSRSSNGKPVYTDLVFASRRGLACL
jgi:FkbM family methyltransferase